MSVSATLLAGYFYQEAIQYVEDNLFPFINRITQDQRSSWEIMPSKVPIGEDAEQNARDIAAIFAELLDTIFQPSITLPASVLHLLANVQTTLDRKYGEGSAKKLLVRPVGAKKVSFLTLLWI